jgi:hypothetical protein
MPRGFRLLLLGEAATFALAAAVHYGALLEGYDHLKAAIAETVIAAVLLAGLVATTLTEGRRARRAALAAQAFAAVGVGVGLFTIAAGPGPRTVLDVVYHLVVLGVLLAGLWWAARHPATPVAVAADRP